MAYKKYRKGDFLEGYRKLRRVIEGLGVDGDQADIPECISPYANPRAETFTRAVVLASCSVPPSCFSEMASVPRATATSLGACSMRKPAGQRKAREFSSLAF